MKIIAPFFLLLPTTIFAADTNGLPTLVPPYPEIPPTFWQQHQTAVIIGGFLFIVVQSLWLYKLLMRLQPKVEPVENLTRAALTGLLNEPEDGKLLSEVPRILRAYFGNQFQTAGAEATTAEFIASLERHPRLTAAVKTKAAALLNECDTAKFAPSRHAPDLDVVERALDLVNEAEQIRAGQTTVKA